MSNLSIAAFRTWASAPSKPDDPTVQAAIDAAEEAVNDYCAREIVVAHASNTSARVYVPRRDSVLRIDDCVEVASVTDDGSTITSTEYQLEPLNNRNASGLAVPYEQIRKLNGYTWVQDYDRATVTVTARWGWSALPDKYTEAVKMLTKDILDMADIRGGVVGFGDFGAVGIRENRTVALLLSRLRRAEAFGIA